MRKLLIRVVRFLLRVLNHLPPPLQRVVIRHLCHVPIHSDADAWERIDRIVDHVNHCGHCFAWWRSFAPPDIRLSRELMSGNLGFAVGAQLGSCLGRDGYVRMMQ